LNPRFLPLLLVLCAPARPQDPPPDQPSPEKWNLLWQATSIGMTHPPFPSPYQGPLSLVPHTEAEASLTSTLFFGLQLPKDTQFYFDPELAGGRGFSNTNGVANFPNGEMPRVSTATPKPYIARLFLTHDFGIGDDRETVEGDENQLAGTRPVNRYTVVIGRFTVTDYFDDNRYSHDPRTQFMGWAIMYNGAWDYPADTRGYTWGWVHEFHTRNWSFKYGDAAMPLVANGERFDRRLFRDHGQIEEVERRFGFHGHTGAARALAYQNRYRGGSYAEALKMVHPDVTASRQPGRLKYGFGLSADQEIAAGIGVFGRLAWNDGQNESFAFTAMDRLAEAGVSINGARWHRKEDTVASAFTSGGLSSVHAEYLRRGGLDFLIGDGTLRYGRENVWESYYSARVLPGVFATVDIQHITNPAYNRDRGPVWVYALRVHIEEGKK
jgi:high affinity Mn2+ porin